MQSLWARGNLPSLGKALATVGLVRLGAECRKISRATLHSLQHGVVQFRDQLPGNLQLLLHRFGAFSSELCLDAERVEVDDIVSWRGSRRTVVEPSVHLIGKRQNGAPRRTCGTMNGESQLHFIALDRAHTTPSVAGDLFPGMQDAANGSRSRLTAHRSDCFLPLCAILVPFDASGTNIFCLWLGRFSDDQNCAKAVFGREESLTRGRSGRAQNAGEAQPQKHAAAPPPTGGGSVVGRVSTESKSGRGSLRELCEYVRVVSGSLRGVAGCVREQLPQIRGACAPLPAARESFWSLPRQP